tara:strand:+ start:18503 stop:19486 length:984 start_codon:yes stop_codon:yes gene_type:complete
MGEDGIMEPTTDTPAEGDAERERFFLIHGYDETADIQEPNTPYGNQTGDEGGYGHQMGWWGEGSESGAMTRGEAGLSDDRAYNRAIELSKIAEGTAGVQQWETDLRKELNVAGRKLYGGVGRAGPNKAALARALRAGMGQKGEEIERLIKTAREEEMTRAGESLEDLLITTRKEGAGVAMAKAGMHQQWLMGQEAARTQIVSSIIGGLATLAGSVIMSVSDARLKEEVAPLEGSLDKVLAIHGVGWEWKNPPGGVFETTPIGFIAQEVESHIPEVVHYDDYGIRRIDYSKLTAVLFEAVKELNSKVGELSGELAQMKGAQDVSTGGN